MAWACKVEWEDNNNNKISGDKSRVSPADESLGDESKLILTTSRCNPRSFVSFRLSITIISLGTSMQILVYSMQYLYSIYVV